MYYLVKCLTFKFNYKSNLMINQLLTTCDQEPIHMLSRIQQNGLLMVTDEYLRIHQISDNCLLFFGKNADEMLKLSLDNIFDPILIQKISRYIEDIKYNKSNFITFVDSFHKQNYFFILHYSSTHTILEISPIDNNDKNHSLTPELLFEKALLNYEQSSSLIDMLTKMATTVKEISGFDRVLIYQFDDEYNGTVLAQVQENFSEDFTNHRFPASDIPVQARALYLKNRFRTISDIDETSAILIPTLNPLSNSPLDMSYCYLRSVSPIHIHYLRNMGVFASMSISLIIDRKLWGLVVCHHHEPKKIPLSLYESYSLLSTLFSTQIEHKESLLHYRNAFELRLARELFFNSLNSKSDLFFLDAVHEEIKQLCLIVPCDIAAFTYGGEWISSSSELSNESLRTLCQYANPNETLFVSSQLGLEYDSKAFNIPLGGLIVTQSAEYPGCCIMFIRYEQIYAINWAGEPIKNITIDNGVTSISPRASFETWKEIVKGTSSPFKKEEIDSALIFTKELFSALTQFSLYDETRRLRQIEVLQKEQLFQNAIEQKILKEREMILYSIGEGVYGVDLDGRCFFVNHAACQILGYTENEIIGQNTHDLIHYKTTNGDDFPFNECIVYLATVSKVQITQNDWLIRKNGEHFPVKIIATPIISDEKLSGIVVAFSDITHEHIAQKKLKNLHEELFKIMECNPL